jgi:hypothetical protein
MGISAQGLRFHPLGKGVQANYFSLGEARLFVKLNLGTYSPGIKEFHTKQLGQASERREVRSE